MKANELMVGDWVKWKNKYVQVASVSGIVWSFGHIDVGLAHCNDDHLLESHDIKSISPIPLTAEILEKNGFRIGHHGTYNIWGFHIGNHYDGHFTPYIDVGYATRDLTYVHELQHALRLGGLNELADNFKI